MEITGKTKHSCGEECTMNQSINLSTRVISLQTICHRCGESYEFQLTKKLLETLPPSALLDMINNEMRGNKFILERIDFNNNISPYSIGVPFPKIYPTQNWYYDFREKEKEKKEMLEMEEQKNVIDEERIAGYLRGSQGRKASVSEMKTALGIPEMRVYKILDGMRQRDLVMKDKTTWILKPDNIDGAYIDWNGNYDRLKKMYEAGIFTLLVGPKGCGKTECTEQLAKEFNIPIHTVNLSLRCKETHMIGRLDVKEKDGVQEVQWLKGPLPRSMNEGSILYLDELSAGEPDVLLRLDECLDDRRQLSYEGETLHAKDGWFCTASINPLSTPGTKPLPPQLISRFPARLWFEYPDLKTEVKIVKSKIDLKDHVEDMTSAIRLFEKMRASEELPYTPSIRESIAFGKMLSMGIELNECIEIVALNPLLQWDRESYNVGRQLASSLGLLKEEQRA